MPSLSGKSTLALGLLATMSLTIAIGAADTPIPDLSGKILTVKGPIEPNLLGPTIMHEHVLIDYRGRPKKRIKSATDASFYEESVSLGNLSKIRTWAVENQDNLLLSDIDLALREVLGFKRWGGSGIVDCTSIGLGRDPSGLLQVSNASGLHLIMGSGFYLESFHPPDMDQRTVGYLADIIIRDVTVGVAGTPIRAGIIGEVAVAGGLKASELKGARAVARASRATGAAISFHHGGAGEEKFTTLDLVASEGADLNRVIIGHANHIATDIPYMKRLLERGVYLQFDLFGEVIPRLGRIHDYEVAQSIV